MLNTGWAQTVATDFNGMISDCDYDGNMGHYNRNQQPNPQHIATKTPHPDLLHHPSPTTAPPPSRPHIMHTPTEHKQPDTKNAQDSHVHAHRQTQTCGHPSSPTFIFTCLLHFVLDNICFLRISLHQHMRNNTGKHTCKHQRTPQTSYARPWHRKWVGSGRSIKSASWPIKTISITLSHTRPLSHDCTKPNPQLVTGPETNLRYPNMHKLPNSHRSNTVSHPFAVVKPTRPNPISCTTATTYTTAINSSS